MRLTMFEMEAWESPVAALSSTCVICPYFRTASMTRAVFASRSEDCEGRITGEVNAKETNQEELMHLMTLSSSTSNEDSSISPAAVGAAAN